MLFGKHTLAETEDLMKTVEFRIQQTEKLNNSITQAQVAVDPAFVADAEQKWTNFRFRWATARLAVGNALIAAKQANRLVDASLIPTETEYQTVRKAINVGGQDTYGPGDLTDCILRIEKIAGAPIDEFNHPVPTGFDPDFEVYKKLDSAIREGEAAAKGAINPFGSVTESFIAKNKTGFIIGGLAAIVLGGFALKKYTTVMQEQAKRTNEFRDKLQSETLKKLAI